MATTLGTEPWRKDYPGGLPPGMRWDDLTQRVEGISQVYYGTPAAKQVQTVSPGDYNILGQRGVANPAQTTPGWAQTPQGKALLPQAAAPSVTWPPITGQQPQQVNPFQQQQQQTGGQAPFVTTDPTTGKTYTYDYQTNTWSPSAPPGWGAPQAPAQPTQQWAGQGNIPAYPTNWKLPAGYQPVLEAYTVDVPKKDAQGNIIYEFDPLTGEYTTNPKMTKETIWQWVPKLTGTGAMTEAERAQLAQNQAQLAQNQAQFENISATQLANLGISKEQWDTMSPEEKTALVRSQNPYFTMTPAQLKQIAQDDRAFNQLSTAQKAQLKQAEDAQLAQATQAAATLKLEQAKFDYQKIQDDLNSLYRDKESARLQGNSNREYELTAKIAEATIQLNNAKFTLDRETQLAATALGEKTFELQKQQAAADTLLRLAEAERVKRESEAGMASNPRDWIKYSLATSGALPGSTGYVSKLTGIPVGETIRPAAITPPSLETLSKMLPSDIAMVKAFASFMGIPEADIEAAWDRIRWKGGTQAPAQWATIFQR